MTIRQFLDTVIKRWWLILLCFLAVGGGAYFGSRFLAPVYQSTALVQVVIRSGSNQADYTNLLASEQLVQTEAQLATSDTVLREVASHYAGLTSTQLAKEAVATPRPNTQLFEIDVQDGSDTRAAALANDIATTLIRQENQRGQQDNTQSQQQLQKDLNIIQQQIEDTTTQIAALQAQGGKQGRIAVLQARLNGIQQQYGQWQAALAQLKLTEAQDSGQLRVVQDAQPDPRPIQPNRLLNTLGGLLAGLVLGVLLAMLFELLDTRVHSAEELTQLLDLPVLATVWRAPSSEKEIVFSSQGYDAYSESYRILRTNIGFSGIDRPVRFLMVTSAQPYDGKSTVAANLAISFARSGKATLLVDADLRRPGQHKIFALSQNKEGLSNAILAFSRLNQPSATLATQHLPAISAQSERTPNNGDALQTGHISLSPFIHRARVPNLWLMPSGPLPPNPSELLDSKAMQHLLTRIDERDVEIVIFDTPPLPGLSDGSILAAKMDGTVVVVDILAHTKEV